ncbi:hypothetical protein Tco_1000306 [Tanacetum coccineum]
MIGLRWHALMYNCVTYVRIKRQFLPTWLFSSINRGISSFVGIRTPTRDGSDVPFWQGVLYLSQRMGLFTHDNFFLPLDVSGGYLRYKRICVFYTYQSTPSRPTTTPAGAPVTGQGHSSDPNIASSSRPHVSTPDLFTSTNVEDDIMEVVFPFHTLRHNDTHTQEGTTSGGAEDLDKLTALSSLVSTLVQKVNTQESDLNAHKLLFKEVVGKLVKKVKLLEDKLKGRKRKFVMTDSDKEEDAEQDVDPLIKLAKAAATAAAAHHHSAVSY